ncbi:MAG: amino acid adenylation domain-containing protein, partial [Verrucomicrobia bacterium]
DEALRAALATSLPEYMLPAAFVRLPSLPLTPAGKVDRRALQGTSWEVPESGRTHVPPRTPSEELLAGIWREVLGKERVGIHDNFFDLGGHSLLAMRMASRIADAQAPGVPLLAIFRYPTIAGLAAHLDAAGGESTRPEPMPAPPDRDRPLPLSFAQQRLWFLDRLHGGSVEYGMPEVARLIGLLDTRALAKAIDRIVARHESLRTVFVERDGAAVQMVVAPPRDALAVVDLSGLEPSAREAAVAEAIERLRTEPFDLARGPLFVARLLRVSSREHVLLRSSHHIVSDGWSLGIFNREMAALYRAFAAGEEDPLEPLPLQYADHAVSQRQRLQGPALAAEIAHWKTVLAGAPDRLELPADGSSTDPGMETCPTVDLLLEPGVARGLESIGLQSQASSFVSLAAAFNLLLGRLAGVEDLVVGIPVAGRHEPETEAMIGLFLNNLALRTDLSGNPTFRGLLDRVNEAVLDALDHSDLPFDRLVAELNPSRSLRHAPVFQVLVNHFDTDALTPVLPGLEVVPVPCTPPGSRYDLTAYFQPGRDGTRVTLAYHPKVFSAARMRGLLDQFAALLEQIVADPDRPIGEYSLVTDGARRWLPDPRATLDGEPHETVLESFRRIVRESPGLVALAQSERAWTYGALAVEVDRLAGIFRQADVRAGAVVAVTGAPSPGLVASLMAVWQAGGVFLPLDPRLPEARQHLMARIARATHLVRVGMPTGDGSTDGWPRDIVRIAVDAVPAAGEDTSATALADDEPSAAEAYVFFTSGTTGIPKAILGTHAGLAHFLHWQRTTFGIGPGDRVAQLTGLSFDVVLRDLFLPLGSGAALCLPPEGHDLAADRVLPWMERERITFLHTVPALASAWMAGVPPGATLGAMRWVFFAGEPLSEKLVREWRGAFAGHTGIVNLYGPTETTLVKCSFEVPDPPLPGIQPVGRALPGAQAWVQNDANQFCGVGEPGEIVIRTPYRTLGYLDAPGGTPRCFRPNPFGTDSGDLVYFTGDRGRLRPDGHLDILGRNDDQAKINGVRVEPAEVNAVLGAHPGIRSSLVLACGDATGATRLVAYLVPRDPGCPPAVGELRRFLARTLPESMVPAAFAVLAAFPLSPNGKVDRKALPAPESVALGSGTIHAPPRTPVEKALADIWCEVLGKQQVGLDDNFFALGGHSLLAMRVVARIRDGFPVDLRVRTLFEHPTLAALAERVVELHREPGASAVPLLRSAALATEKPLSFAQQRLWFLDGLSPGSPAYNIPTATRLLGLLDAPALGQALRELVRRHEVLRTTFAAAEGEPELIVATDPAFRLESVDLRSLPAESREPEARRLAAAEAARPFDLSRDPMLRASLLRMADDDHLFVFTLHHIAADAWSMGILWRELALLYRAFAAGLPSPLAPLSLRYADYALWQRQWLRGEVLERQLDYWKNQLAGAPPLLELPVDF